MTKPETKQVDEWAAGTAYVVEKSRLRQGDPDPRHIMATAIIISQHLDPAVKKLVEAARKALPLCRIRTGFRKGCLTSIGLRLQSALQLFKEGE